MLHYMKNYHRLSYVLMVLVPLVLIIVVSAAMGQNLLSAPFGAVIVVAIIAASSWFVSLFMNRTAERKARQIVSLFDDDCDPITFLEKGDDIARRIKEPSNEWGCWFLGYYSLALIDQGHKEAAGGYVEIMRKSIESSKSPEDSFAMYLNLYQPVKELYGDELAQKCLTEAEALMAQLSTEPEGAGFITWASRLQAASDNEELATLYTQIFADEGQPLRMRVWAAYQASQVYISMEEPEKRKACLEFVITYGNKLHLVELAQKDLAAI